MRFKSFLFESNNSLTPLTREEAITIARKNCKEALTSREPLVARGLRSSITESKEEFRLVKPSSVIRKSANTSNEYNLLLSNLPSWKEYPPRNKSIICATFGNIEYTKSFGDSNIVIPFNGAKFGVCPAFDLWESFPKLHNLFGDPDYQFSLHEFNSTLVKLCYKAKISYNSNLSYDTLLKIFDKLTIYFNSLESPDSFDKKFIDAMNGKSFLQLIEQLFSPRKNGFKVLPYLKLKSDVANHKEVWTDSDSILFRPVVAPGTGYQKDYAAFRNEVLLK